MLLRLILNVIFCFLGFVSLFNITFTVPTFLRIKKKRKKIKIKKIDIYQEKINSMLLIIGSKTTLKQYNELSLLLCFLGFSIGMYFNNILVSIVLSVGLPFFQYQMLLKHKNDLKRSHNEKLEIYMSIVTNAYIQTGDIEAAILNNYSRMDSKEAAAKPFGAFIGQSAGNADISQCIADMKKDIDNIHFKQWCDKLILCRENASLRYVLPYVINRMRRKRTLDNETITGCHKHYKEFILISILSLIMTLLMPMLQPTWKYIVTNTLLGKIITAAVLVVIFLAIAYVVKINSMVGDKNI